MNFLREKGMNADNISKTHASQLIDAFVRRREAGGCTFKMIKQLRRHGFSPDLNAKQGGMVMAKLAEFVWHKEKDRPRIFPESEKAKLREIFAKQDAEKTTAITGRAS